MTQEIKAGILNCDMTKECPFWYREYYAFYGRTDTIFYDEDNNYIGKLDKKQPEETIKIWIDGFIAGYGRGYRFGTQKGFADCQAGIRALLGSASSNDVETLLRAAGNAR
jgi:hypothetical protein